MIDYDCMTPDEFALWADQVARARVSAPCYDCPAWFHAQEQAAGRCDRRAGPGRPVADVTDERRAQWREAARRLRAKRSQ